MFEWPPNWELFFWLVTFLAASTAVRGWRELGILILLSAVVIWPIKWIGPTLGFPALGENAFNVTGPERYSVGVSAALVASLIVASLMMIVWKEVGARRSSRPPSSM